MYSQTPFLRLILMLKSHSLGVTGSTVNSIDKYGTCETTNAAEERHNKRQTIHFLSKQVKIHILVVIYLCYWYYFGNFAKDTSKLVHLWKFYLIIIHTKDKTHFTPKGLHDELVVVHMCLYQTKILKFTYKYTKC